MFKKSHWAVMITLSIVLASGCATTPSRDYQPELNSLNAKIADLQNQLAVKDTEMARLHGEMGNQTAALKQVEADKQSLNQKLDDALAKLSAASAKPAPKKYDSDLK